MASNQLSSKELEELKRLYKQIDALSQSQADSAAQSAQNIGNARQELERLRKEYTDLTSDISSSLTAFQRIVQEITNQNKGIRESTKAYNKLTSIAEKIQYHQRGISQLSAKEIVNLKSQIEKEKIRLENAQQLLKDKTSELLTGKLSIEQEIRRLGMEIRRKRAAGENNNYELKMIAIKQRELDKNQKSLAQTQSAISENNALLNNQNQAYTGLVTTADKLNEELGITGRLVGKLGNIPGIGESLSGIAESVLKIGTAAFWINVLVDAFKSIDDGAGKLAKSMDMSYKGALALREQLSSIATSSGDVAVNTKGLQESYMAIGQALGANADINKEDLKTFTKLREQAGFTNEELTAMYKMSLVTGKSVEQTSEEFLGGAEALAAQKGLAINVKQLMKETSNASAAMKLSVVGGAKGLAEAAIQAKALGVTLDQVDKIAGSLLQFEDSISSELEAELLTGKQINLERARLAALNGDIATVAEEINNQIGGSAEFSKMNRIQQEAFAKAVGMTREELAASLVEQEALQKVGAKTGEEAKAKYELLRKTMTAEQAAAALGDEALARQYEQQNVQERFAQAVEKLKDIFVTIVDGPLGTMMGFIADLLSNSTAIYGIFGLIAGLMTGKMIMGLGAMIPKMIQMTSLAVTQAIAAISTASATTFGLGTLAIVGGIAAAAYAMNAASESASAKVAQVKDGAMGLDPNGGPVLASFQQGELTPIAQGIKQDKAFLTTNKPIPSQNNTSTVVIDYDRLAAAMSRVNITLDGKTVTDSVNDRNYKSTVRPQ